MLTAGIFLGILLSSSQGAYSAPAKQELFFADKAVIRVRPMFIIAADDDGGHRHTAIYGRTGKNETPAEIAAMVRDINKAFECARIRLEFDPKQDYVARNRTALNRNFSSDLNGASLDLPESAMTDRSKIPSRWDPKFTEAKVKLVEEFPNRVVFLLQDGTAWHWNEQRKRWTPSTQSMGLTANGMITASEVKSPLLIHELGHLFGLSHTFANVRSDSLPRALSLIAEEAKKGKSLKESTRIFDGDGFADTPEDPGRPFLESLGYKAFRPPFGWDVNVPGADGDIGAWKVQPDVYNWMSYYPEANFPHPLTGKVEGRFSREQCARMREYLTTKLAKKVI